MAKQSSKPRVHFVKGYMANPVHRISVDLVGAGGSGSQMLSCLARIDHSLRALHHQGLAVRVFDPDTVEVPNLGRQLFFEDDLGVNKAEALVSRYNRGYGLDWEAVDGFYRLVPDAEVQPNLLITCVDNVQTRLETGAAFREVKGGGRADEDSLFYWLDLGNAQKSGQAILGSTDIPQPESKKFIVHGRLPSVTEQFDLTAVNEEDSVPSCSLAEALRKQDLFINSTLVNAAASLLWTLLREPAIDTRGFFLNLDTMRMAPLKIT